MTDDIVTRLKELATEERPLWRSAMVEAADEIERLRASVINTSDNAFDEVERLRADRERWAGMAERLYDIMLAHETVSDNDWNQGIEDCHKLMMGDVRATNNSNP
jgi:hypothetical protein